MIAGYRHGGFTFAADDHNGSDRITLLITRESAFTDDAAQRINGALSDFGAELIPNPDVRTGGWVLRAEGQALDYDNGKSDHAVLTGQVRRR